MLPTKDLFQILCNEVVCVKPSPTGSCPEAREQGLPLSSAVMMSSVLLILLGSYEINHCLILPLDPGAQEALDPLAMCVHGIPSSGPTLHTFLYFLLLKVTSALQKTALGKQ